MSRYRIVIRAFTLRRDAASALLLARVLERFGCRVIVASSRDFLRTIRYWNPDAVVVNTGSQVLRVAREAPDTAIVMWPGEGGEEIRASTAMILSNMPGAYERLDLALLWGRTQEDYFHQLYPNSDHRKLVLCGNPRLDLTKFNLDLLNLPSAGKTVGFIGRYHTLNRYNRVPAIFSMKFPEKRKNMLIQVENFIGMITIIHRILKETDFRISIRPNPLEAPEGYAFVDEDSAFKGRVEIDDSLDVAAWTARQRVIVAPCSPSFFESYLLGVPVINIEPLTGVAEYTRDIMYKATLSLHVSHNPATYDEAMALIKRNLEAKKGNREVDEYLDEFHGWFLPHSAIKHGADAIVAMLEKRGRVNGARLPAAALDLWDRASFARARLREPLHPNFSYHKHFHPTPAYFDRIVENILDGRSILK